jgi:hypothetical protein
MPNIRKDSLYKEMYSWYLRGYSLSQIGKMFGMTRQSVFAGFQIRAYSTRPLVRLPFVEFDGLRFTLRNQGYYARTDGDRELMHRYMWMKLVGPIPDGYDIHHKDEDKTHNEISNFECLPKAEHTRKYSPHCNQFVCNCGKHPKRRKKPETFTQ